MFILKKIDFNELEEWCASELCGMSKSRILSILNATPMIHSSATSESDDSGPSLEIISDTEAWITDNEQQVKQQNQTLPSKSINKTKKRRKIKIEPVKVIKKETTNDQVKPQEGESLLDLLELEMRARAIRALIRKEEDVVNPLEGEKNLTTNPNVLKQNQNNKSTFGLLNVTNTDCNKINLSTIDINKSKFNDINMPSTSLINVGLDEDLVLVVKPTPMISLLSSDGDSDDSKQSKNKLDNKNNKIPTLISSDTSKIVLINQTDNHENNLTTDKQITIVNTKSPIIDKTVISSNSECDKSPNRKIDRVHLSRTIKKKTNYRKKSNTVTNTVQPSCSKYQDKSAQLSPLNDKNNKNIKIIAVVNEQTQDQLINNEAAVKINITEKNTVKVLAANEPDIVDFEEIIDLDDYPDDMDDIENDTKISSSTEKSIKPTNSTINNDNDGNIKITPNCAETWASRYYQTDNVQNVIKDSKIQSEIRKRLRERQKLSKLNILNKTDTTTVTIDEKKNEIIEVKATGSVEEYLAIKANISVNDDKMADGTVTGRETGNSPGYDPISHHVNDTTDVVDEDDKLPLPIAMTDQSATDITRITDIPTP